MQHGDSKDWKPLTLHYIVVVVIAGGGGGGGGAAAAAAAAAAAGCGGGDGAAAATSSLSPVCLFALMQHVPLLTFILCNNKGFKELG